MSRNKSHHNKIAHAKWMLETSNASIEQISGSLGFSNACYFSSTFKKKEGVSPLAYRKAVRSGKSFNHPEEA